MTAITEGRNTKRRNADHVSHLVSTGATIYAGTMITLLATGGLAVSAGTAAAGRCVGVAEETVTGDGTERVTARAGCFQFANSATTDLIAAADIGGIAYIADNQTVAKTDSSGTREVAGSIVDVDAAGVWVQIGPGAVGPAGADGV